MPGETIITSSVRLARALRYDFDRQQIRNGHTVWEAADILPLRAFLKRCWQQWLYATNAAKPAQLLSPWQERSIWQAIVARSDAGRELIQVEATADAALDAWNLLQEWHVPLAARDWMDARDSEVFHQWAEEFQRLCERSNWLPSAALQEFVSAKMDSGEITVPQHIRFAGFAELTPAQKIVFETLRRTATHFEAYEPPVRIQSTQAQRIGFSDTHAEIVTAARWARKILENAADSGVAPPAIGVVAPELSRLRSEIERVFAEELHPSRRLSPEGDAERAFNISLGPALADYSIIQIAFVILRLDPESIPFNDLTSVLRSPFVATAGLEGGLYAQLDIRLRRLREPLLSIRDVRASAPPGLQSVLQRWEREFSRMPELQTASDWMTTFSAVLKAMGWPGDRPLNSTEYQTIAAWTDMLAEFAGLDPVRGPMSAGSAVAMLARFAMERQFQPESKPAPIQILGELEASGQEFDHLWLLGMHDGAWPRASVPSPFIPLRLQRLGNLPQSSPQRELEYATLWTERLMASAADIVVSYPKKENDADLRPSPLFAGLPEADLAALRLPDAPGHAELLFQSSQQSPLETLAIDSPPPWAGARYPGGTSIFKKQAACPFQAFAYFRLGAERLESPAPGLSALDRGDLLHSVLHRTWVELGAHETLVATSRESLDAIVHDEVQGSLRMMASKRRALRRPRFAAIEMYRLERLVAEWLELEKRRQPFSVIASEKPLEVRVGGIDFTIRPDRVDKLTDGTHVVIDYKTSSKSAALLEGSRPDEPQLPLYAITADVPLSGVLFGVAKLGEMKFAGVVSRDGLVPTVKTDSTGVTLNDRISNWRAVLENLASDFRAGRAAVSPKTPNLTCRNCRLHTLCRIGEMPGAAADAAPDDDDEETAFDD